MKLRLFALMFTSCLASWAAQESPDFSKLSKEQLIEVYEKQRQVAKAAHAEILAKTETFLEMPDAQCIGLLLAHLPCIPKVLFPIIMAYGKPELPRNFWPSLGGIVNRCVSPAMVSSITSAHAIVNGIKSHCGLDFNSGEETIHAGKIYMDLYQRRQMPKNVNKFDYLDDSLWGYAAFHTVYADTLTIDELFNQHTVLSGIPRPIEYRDVHPHESRQLIGEHAGRLEAVCAIRNIFDSALQIAGAS